MDTRQCCQCGCADSLQWVCTSCNTPPHPHLNHTPHPSDLLQTPQIHLSTIKKDLFNTQSCNQQTLILTTPDKQQPLPQEHSFPLGTEGILCQEHNEPIAFFNQERHELFCAICLFNSSISKQSIRPYGLVPIKSSTDIVMKQFKSTMEEITELSRYLDQYLRKSIQYQGMISKHQAYLSLAVSNASEEIVRMVKEKEGQILSSINQRLEEQSKIYQLHQSHLKELKSNIKSLRSLGKRAPNPSLQISELVYLFQAAKSIKKSLMRNTFKVQDFRIQDYSIKGVIHDKQSLNKIISGVFGWVQSRDKKGKSLGRHTRRDKYLNGGYSEKSRKVLR